MERIIIFDTTLRDGEQSPGASMNTAEKVRLAHQLERLGVDVIEAGFPISSPGDFEGVQAVAGAVKRPQVAALARCQRGDIDRAWEAVKEAANPRLHVFLATSDIHIKHKLRKSREWVLQAAATVGTRKNNQNRCPQHHHNPNGDDYSPPLGEARGRLVEIGLGHRIVP